MIIVVNAVNSMFVNSEFSMILNHKVFFSDGNGGRWMGFVPPVCPIKTDTYKYRETTLH